MKINPTVSLKNNALTLKYNEDHPLPRLNTINLISIYKVLNITIPQVILSLNPDLFLGQLHISNPEERGLKISNSQDESFSKLERVFYKEVYFKVGKIITKDSLICQFSVNFNAETLSLVLQEYLEFLNKNLAPQYCSELNNTFWDGF